MTKIADSALWAEVVSMARQGVEPTVAFRKIRTMGGRDLTKDDAEFGKIYERYQRQPLFARNMLLTLRRSEFQQSVVDSMLEIDVESDAQVDGAINLLEQFEKGSLQAMLACIERVRSTNPDLAATLTDNAKTLWPGPFAQMEAQQNAARAQSESAAQLELPFPAESELGSPGAELPSEG